MPFSDYTKTGMLGFAAGPRRLVSLHTGDPGQSGANEVHGGTYKRQQVSLRLAGDLLENVGAAPFEGMPVCRITHVAVWDAEGHNLGWGPLNEARMIANDGDTYNLRAGDISFGIRE